MVVLPFISGNLKEFPDIKSLIELDMDLLSLGPAINDPFSGSCTLPIAFTTTNAPTNKPSPKSTLADPSPPFTDLCGPWVFPTVAPVPAPTHPCSTGSEEANSQA